MDRYAVLADFYDSLTYDVDYPAFADYYERLFELYECKVKTVLDAACGTGTLSAILRARCYDMICVDRSEEMLMQAAEKLSEVSTGPEPLLLCQSLEELDLYGTVDAAVCSLDGMNYIEPTVLDEVMHRFSLFIEPGGLLIFDVNSPEKLLGLDGQCFVDETDDVFCVWRAQVTEDSSACEYGFDFFIREEDGWQRENEEHVEYVYESETLVKALQKAGFEEIRVFGELSLEAPQPGEQRLFFAARRNRKY